MGKWLIRIAIVLAALLGAAALAVYVGGPSAVERFLRREIAVGGGRLRISGPQFRWNLDLTADSLRYESPDLSAAVGRVRVSANLFRSLFRFSPSLNLDLDSLALVLHNLDDSLVEKPERTGPPAFPDFDVPASLDLRIGHASASGDSVRLGSLTDVTLVNRGKRSARLEIGRARLPALDTLAPSLALDLDWSGKEEVSGGLVLKLSAAEEGDGARLDLKLKKADLRKGQVELRTRIASIARYASFLGGSPYAAGAGGWEGRVKANLDLSAGMRAAVDLNGRFGGLSAKTPFPLGPQRVDIRFDFRDTAGSWSFSSRSDKAGRGGKAIHGGGTESGPKGEAVDVDLKGRLAVTATDSLQNPAWLARHLAVALSGKAAGIPVKAAGRNLTANLVLEHARLSPGKVAVRAVTGDSSVLEADLEAGRKGWNGTFSAVVAPGEAWMLAFVDTNVAFRRFTAFGSIKDGRIRAVTEALYLSAYGVLADTLVAAHRYGREGYILESGRLIRAGTSWALAGKADLSKRSKPMALSMDGGDAGSAEASMPRAGLFELRTRGLAVHRLPYKGLDSLAAYAPKVSGTFRWDLFARDGMAEIEATGRYRGEPVAAGVKAAWDSARLELKSVDAELGGSRARGYASVRLHGRQFNDLKGLRFEDLEKVALEADSFDLAKAMRAAMPKPPILSGTLQGRFQYSPSAGFAGRYRVENVQPEGTEGLMAVRQIDLRGDGDTLRILAITVSKKEPLLNDTLSAFLSGALERSQIVGFEAKVGRSLVVGFRGRMESFKDIRGLATLGGSVQLPEKSGTLRGLRLRAQVSTVFKDALAGLKVEADTLVGEYLVPGIDTQSFSAPLMVADGRLVVPDLVIRSRNGSEVRGRVEYALAGARVLTARLAGGGLVMQLGAADKVQLRDLRVDVKADSSFIDLTAFVGGGSFEHVKSPMRAAGDFSRVEVAYRSALGNAPPGSKSKSKLAPALLTVRAVVDSSNLRYRLRTMETLKNTLRNIGRKKTSEKRQARVSRPLQVDINLETSGSGNHVETDILRFAYVGNLSVRGIMPYALTQGRITGTGGQLGTKRQAYDLRRLEVKWLNAPMEEGLVAIEAAKKLAKTCEVGNPDSCNVTTRLDGSLADIKFTYDTDCGGAFGAGADVAALLYSVRRGCYSGNFVGNGTGATYEERALALLEPYASQYLTTAAEKLSRNWIESAEITGLGALASSGDKAAAADASGSTEERTEARRESIALEVMSREFWRLRVRLRSSYSPENAEELDPWAYRVGLEWRPPLFRVIDDPKWNRRLKNNVVVEAAVFTEPARATDLNQDEVRQRLGLNYNYDFWGNWWAKEKPRPASARVKAGADSLR